MKAPYKKETLPDPTSEKKTYDNFTLQKGAEFCCDDFKSYCKKFTGWSYEHGKFAIVDQISYEGHSMRPVNFCPFCGEEIEYDDIDSTKKVQKRKK